MVHVVEKGESMNRSMRVLAVGLITFAILAKGSLAAAQDDVFVECVKQKYALCATASCFVYNQVAYCECDFIKKGTSISAALDSPEGDVCDLNQQGKKGGYVMSTFSVPDSVLAPDGTQALYTCPEGSTGAYAQCDGGFCFKSTKGKRFPGFEGKLKGEIICACPITFAPPVRGHSYQIAGDFDGQCDPDVFKQCEQRFPDNIVPQGTIIPVGAPPGTALLLGTILNGSPPDANECTSEK